MKPGPLWILVVTILLGPADRLTGAEPGAPAPEAPAAEADRPIDLNSVAGRSVLVVPIKGEIGLTSVYFIKRSIRYAEREKIGVILFEFDTPGGSMAAMMEITTLLGRLSDIPTIGFVNPSAGSAGAIILAGTEFIYMSDASKVGAAALVATGPEGIVELPERILEKYNSYIRADVRALSERNGHPFALFQAMIDQTIHVQEVTVDGKREVLTDEDIANLQIQLQRGEVHDIQLGEVVVPKGRLLTLTNKQAERWGLSRGSVPDRQALLNRIGMGDFKVYESGENWSEGVSRFFTNPIVVLFLIMAGAIGIYVELNTPGFGVPGIVGIAAFALLFIGQYVAGLAGVIEPILFLLGVTLLAVEIFVIPGFGVTGALGILLILVSVILGGQDFVLPSGDFEGQVFMRNLTTVAGGMLLSIVGMVLLARYLPQTRAFDRIALRAPEKPEELHASAGGATAAAAVGDVGRAVTTLRPAGKARFDERHIDVVAEGAFIDAGTTVEVTRVSGNRVVVRPKAASEETS